MANTAAMDLDVHVFWTRVFSFKLKGAEGGEGVIVRVTDCFDHMEVLFVILSHAHTLGYFATRAILGQLPINRGGGLSRYRYCQAIEQLRTTVIDKQFDKATII